MSSSDWDECVRWCNYGQVDQSVDDVILGLMDLCDRSTYVSPIVTCRLEERGVRAEGYAILYPGALASIGNLRAESLDRLGPSPLPLLTRVVETLNELAFVQGVEIIQAISRLLPANIPNQGLPIFDSLDQRRDAALINANMNPIAKLVQLVCNDLRKFPEFELSGLQYHSRGAVSIVPFDTIPVSQWHQAIEDTYIETLDVPELNGVRRMEDTLAGYASTVEGIPTTWWAIQCGSETIGCLMLTPIEGRRCELTYVGIVPCWRGLGLSKLIMNYLRDWALRHEIETLLLAVDVRNTPAIRLYQKCGFEPERFVQAWLMARR